MNGVNINLFQFERDLTWMAFFMNAENGFYTRYGGREDASAESHLTKDSMVRTMKHALELHRDGQVQKSRYEPKPETVRTPEEIPTMKALMAGRNENRCIHCHDVKVAELKHFQKLGRFTRDMVFTYPGVSATGIQLDPDVQNKIRAVIAKSPAESAGLRAGDTVLSADGQRILTFADFTRVLELTPAEAELPMAVQRGDQTLHPALKLSGQWRRTTDPSWRESLHVAGPGCGFWGEKLPEEERRKLGLPAGGMAVRVTFIWGDHARRAGLKQQDIVVEFDGLKTDMTIGQLHAHLNLNRNYGDTISISVRRGKEDEKLVLDLPKSE